MVNPQLLDYVQEQVERGIPLQLIRSTLLDNDWTNEDVSEAFSVLNVSEQSPDDAIAPSEGAAVPAQVSEFYQEHLTIDKIIEKIVPIVGALFLIIGLGYLIYANAWVKLGPEVRIGLGFFAGIAIIGGSFSLREKMRYLTDVGIGSGILMLYGTLVYGSRATETAEAIIPELATLLTAVLFTVGIAYFASRRKSKVILMLGMIGAYLTPFVIGQNDVWVNNVSFNAYLIYFFAVNVAVFLIGREISVRDVIPLNIIGLFVGITTLWGLASSQNIDAVHAENFFTSEVVTAFLFTILVIFSILSILISATRFKESDDGYLSLGYIAPIIWFAYNVSNLGGVSDVAVGIFYFLIAVACFGGWHILQGRNTRYQHTALYAAGLLSLIIGFFTVIQELNVYTSILISYLGLIFATLYIFDSSKSERFISYGVVSLIGSIFSIHHILDAGLKLETLYIIIALLPAMSAYLIARIGGREEFYPAAKIYSFASGVTAFFFLLREFIEYININFVGFYLVPLAILVYVALLHRFAPNDMDHDAKSTLLRATLGWFALGFFGVFVHLFVSIYPAPTDLYLFTNTELSLDMNLVKGVFATLILFVGLYISRKLQLEQVIKRPSFLLVIFGFTTLLLTGNYIISAIANDLQVSMEHGGPRAIATTIWWALVAIYMLIVGIKFGKKYHSEKLLGLVLLALTVGKVILYDIATMSMQNKIIVLMVVGGGMLLFSYFIRSKNLLGTEEEVQEQLP
jgi:hypothetical protein